jgi:hypothetical protein
MIFSLLEKRPQFTRISSVNLRRYVRVLFYLIWKETARTNFRKSALRLPVWYHTLILCSLIGLTTTQEVHCNQQGASPSLHTVKVVTEVAKGEIFFVVLVMKEISQKTTLNMLFTQIAYLANGRSYREIPLIVSFNNFFPEKPGRLLRQEYRHTIIIFHTFGFIIESFRLIL